VHAVPRTFDKDIRIAFSTVSVAYVLGWAKDFLQSSLESSHILLSFLFVLPTLTELIWLVLRREIFATKAENICMYMHKLHGQLQILVSYYVWTENCKELYHNSKINSGPTINKRGGNFYSCSKTPTLPSRGDETSSNATELIQSFKRRN